MRVTIDDSGLCCCCRALVPFQDVPLVEFVCLVFIGMPDESYRRRLGSLLYLCDVFLTLINSLMCFHYDYQYYYYWLTEKLHL